VKTSYSYAEQKVQNLGIVNISGSVYTGSNYYQAPSSHELEVCADCHNWTSNAIRHLQEERLKDERPSVNKEKVDIPSVT
jgi:hypothetical protein